MLSPPIGSQQMDARLQLDRTSAIKSAYEYLSHAYGAVRHLTVLMHDVIMNLNLEYSLLIKLSSQNPRQRMADAE